MKSLRSAHVFSTLLLASSLLTGCGAPPPTSQPEATAQPVPTLEPSCPALVAQALAAVDSQCADLSRNQLCYGNTRVEVVPRAGAGRARFDAPGDRLDIGVVQALRLSPMDVAAALWGVALMKLQADLPDTLPGQNVTFVLFGDVELRPIPPETGDANIRAFYFRSGFNDAPCQEAPASGMLVQTPEGASKVSFHINEVDIRLGSTAFMQAEAGREMAVSVVEGEAEVTAQGVTRTVPAGSKTRVPLDANLQAAGAPAEPEPYDAVALRPLPVSALERPVAAAAPLRWPTATPFSSGPAGAAPIGFRVSDAITAPGEQKTYTFTAQPGQTVLFDGQGRIASDLRWRVVDEDGAPVFADRLLFEDIGPVTLERGGVYTLTVSGDGDKTGDYAFQISQS